MTRAFWPEGAFVRGAPFLCRFADSIYIPDRHAITDRQSEPAVPGWVGGKFFINQHVAVRHLNVSLFVTMPAFTELLFLLPFPFRNDYAYSHFLCSTKHLRHIAFIYIYSAIYFMALAIIHHFIHSPL